MRTYTYIYSTKTQQNTKHNTHLSHDELLNNMYCSTCTYFTRLQCVRIPLDKLACMFQILCHFSFRSPKNIAVTGKVGKKQSFRRKANGRLSTHVDFPFPLLSTAFLSSFLPPFLLFPSPLLSVLFLSHPLSPMCTVYFFLSRCFQFT